MATEFYSKHCGQQIRSFNCFPEPNEDLLLMRSQYNEEHWKDIYELLEDIIRELIIL